MAFKNHSGTDRAKMTPKGGLAPIPFWEKQACSKPMSAPRLKAGGLKKELTNQQGEHDSQRGSCIDPLLGETGLFKTDVGTKA